MTRAEEPFDVFKQEYTAWHRHTQALPFRRARGLPKGAFELDLDHVIDYVQPILAAAAKRSTQFDYPKVASEYLHDLDQLQAELESAPLGDSDRQADSGYLFRCRRLLSHLGSLPVPPEGHLDFRGHALQAFRFVIDEYGFEVAGTSPISAQFVTAVMFLDLSYLPECPMNSILVGRRACEGTPPSGFILDDFAYVAGLGVVFDYERFNLSDSAGIAMFLLTAAFLVRSYGGSLLTGDLDTFRRFESKSDEREQSYIAMMDRQHSAEH
jgi:hypothetical protein